MNNSRAIIFDLDDTLYCEHDYVRSGFKAVAKEICQTFTSYKDDYVYLLMEKEWLKNGRGTVFNAVCNQLNVQININYLVEIYRQHKPSLSLYPDAERLLSYLQSRKIPRGIITDGDRRVQWRKIEELQLQKTFPCIIVTDDLGRQYWKPSETPYLKAMENLRVAPQDCVYIGDNPHKDFCTPKRLGMQTIRIIRPVGDHMQTVLSSDFEADENVHSLDEILDLYEL